MCRFNKTLTVAVLSAAFTVASAAASPNFERNVFATLSDLVGHDNTPPSAVEADRETSPSDTAAYQRSDDVPSACDS